MRNSGQNGVGILQYYSSFIHSSLRSPCLVASTWMAFDSISLDGDMLSKALLKSNNNRKVTILSLIPTLMYLVNFRRAVRVLFKRRKPVWRGSGQNAIQAKWPILAKISTVYPKLIGEPQLMKILGHNKRQNSRRNSDQNFNFIGRVVWHTIMEILCQNSRHNFS